MKIFLRATTIERILTRSNLSQRDFAKKLGTSSGYLSQLMEGVRCPSPRMRARIMDKLLGYNWDDLFQSRNRL